MTSILVVHDDCREVSRPIQVPSSRKEEKERVREACLPAEAIPFKELLRKGLPALRLMSPWPESSHLTQMQVLAGGLPIAIKSVH